MLNKGRSFSSTTTTPARFLQLTSLPDVPVDKIITFLKAEDLRRFHQVSSEWKLILEKRPIDDERRLKLVKQIRENKENIINRPTRNETVPAEVAAFREFKDHRLSDMEDKKAVDSPVLMEYTSHFQNTPTFTNSQVSTPDCSSLATPPSHFVFQDFQEAEKNLEPGQTLVQCRKCRGPVPSPITSKDSQPLEPRRLTTQPLRCKLVSRLQYQDVETPQKREFKKPKTLSATDLSPIQCFSPPVTVASLGEKMTHSLVLSSPCLSSSATSHHHATEQFEDSTETDIKRSTSCSSIREIDLPGNTNERSQIDVSLNFSANSFDRSNHMFDSTCLDFHSISSPRWSCTRSCCNYEDLPLPTSQFSDSGFGLGSLSATTTDICEFNNFVPSPVMMSGEAPVFSMSTYQDNSCERGRNFQDYNSSNEVFSGSSLQLQGSDHSLSVGNSMFLAPSINSISTLECPNPTCGYRFCSFCQEREHPERPCLMVSSEQFESSFESSSSNNKNESCLAPNSSSLNKDDSSSSRKNKSKHKSNKKSSLKRLARLQ